MRTRNLAIVFALLTAPLPAFTPALPAQQRIPSPEALRVGLAARDVPASAPLRITLRRRSAPRPWLIGALIGGVLGAWYGHHHWRENSPDGESAFRDMAGFGLIGAGIGAIVGRTLGASSSR